MNDLVLRLSKQQPVEVGLRPEKSLALLREAVQRGYVLVRFVKTDTELGVRMDRERSDTSAADLTLGRGRLKLVGELVLNYVRVRCHADIEVVTLGGTGYLEILGEVTAAELAKERATATRT